MNAIKHQRTHHDLHASMPCLNLTDESPQQAQQQQRRPTVTSIPEDALPSDVAVSSPPWKLMNRAGRGTGGAGTVHKGGKKYSVVQRTEKDLTPSYAKAVKQKHQKKSLSSKILETVKLLSPNKCIQKPSRKIIIFPREKEWDDTEYDDDDDDDDSEYGYHNDEESSSSSDSDDEDKDLHRFRCTTNSYFEDYTKLLEQQERIRQRAEAAKAQAVAAKPVKKIEKKTATVKILPPPVVPPPARARCSSEEMTISATSRERCSSEEMFSSPKNHANNHKTLKTVKEGKALNSHTYHAPSSASYSSLNISPEEPPLSPSYHLEDQSNHSAGGHDQDQSESSSLSASARAQAQAPAQIASSDRINKGGGKSSNTNTMRESDNVSAIPGQKEVSSPITRSRKKCYEIGAEDNDDDFEGELEGDQSMEFQLASDNTNKTTRSQEAIAEGSISIFNESSTAKWSIYAPVEVQAMTIARLRNSQRRQSGRLNQDSLSVFEKSGHSSSMAAAVHPTNAITMEDHSSSASHHDISESHHYDSHGDLGTDASVPPSTRLTGSPKSISKWSPRRTSTKIDETAAVFEKKEGRVTATLLPPAVMTAPPPSKASRGKLSDRIKVFEK